MMKVDGNGEDIGGEERAGEEMKWERIGKEEEEEMEGKEKWQSGNRIYKGARGAIVSGSPARGVSWTKGVLHEK